MQTNARTKPYEDFDPLFTLKEVISIIRAERSKIYELLKSGDLHAVKLNGSTLFRKSELDRFLSTAKPATFRKSNVN